VWCCGKGGGGGGGVMLQEVLQVLQDVLQVLQYVLQASAGVGEWRQLQSKFFIQGVMEYIFLLHF
jgi:hypothetical protein